VSSSTKGGGGDVIDRCRSSIIIFCPCLTEFNQEMI